MDFTFLNHSVLNLTIFFFKNEWSLLTWKFSVRFKFFGLNLTICLLLLICNDSSCCSESQREAALLLGQFASADSDCKVK